MVVAVLGLVACALDPASRAWAQEAWTWPEKTQNLQKLPADWPGARLRPVMNGFTRALGVGCSHCHVGEPGQPLSTYDFVSDANPKKEIARKMLDLLGSVGEQLGELGIPREDRVNMWCHTCHRGVPQPRRLDEELARTYRLEGVEATAKHYRELRERFAGTWSYDFSRPALVSTAASAVEKGETADAVALLRLDLDLHPDSARVHGGLAEAYAAAGRPELARIHAARALELAPDDESALETLRHVESRPPAETPP